MGCCVRFSAGQAVHVSLRKRASRFSLVQAPLRRSDASVSNNGDEYADCRSPDYLPSTVSVYAKIS